MFKNFIRYGLIPSFALVVSFSSMAVAHEDENTCKDYTLEQFIGEFIVVSAHKNGTPNMKLDRFKIEKAKKVNKLMISLPDYESDGIDTSMTASLAVLSDGSCALKIEDTEEMHRILKIKDKKIYLADSINVLNKSQEWDELTYILVPVSPQE